MSQIQPLCFLECGQHLHNGLRRCGALGLNRKLISMAHAERHDADHAARIGGAAVRTKRDRSRNAFGAPCQQRRRPGMQALRQGDRDGALGADERTYARR